MLLTETKHQHIGEILKKLRVDNGYTLRTLAKEIELDYSRISVFERRTTPPPQHVLEKYHNFFRVSYEFLLGKTDDPSSTDIGKPRFETKETHSLKKLAEENSQYYNTLSYLLTNPYGQVLLEELTDGFQRRDMSKFPEYYTKVLELESKKGIYTQDEIRTYIRNQKRGL